MFIFIQVISRLSHLQTELGCAGKERMRDRGKEGEQRKGKERKGKGGFSKGKEICSQVILVLNNDEKERKYFFCIQVIYMLDHSQEEEWKGKEGSGEEWTKGKEEG